MKRFFIYFNIVFIFLIYCTCLFGIGEKIAGIGSVSGWNEMALDGLNELSGLRPSPVLALSSVTQPVLSSDFSKYLPDMYLSFDEGNPVRFRDSTGNYNLEISRAVNAADSALARHGAGAARFYSGDDNAISIKPGPGALFAPGNHIRDFTVEFWLCPANPENGDQILNWSSVLTASSSGFINQRIQCVVSRNRLQWSFMNFFLDARGSPPDSLKTVTLTGTPVIPKTWSHHLVRFNSDYGILEYLVDGISEAIVYTTSSGRDSGEVYTPVTGANSGFTLGGRYAGLIDEFRIYPDYLEKPALTRYLPGGGRAESRTIDLGSVQNRLIKLEASGGRISGSIYSRNEFAGAGNFRFSDHSEIRFYIRFSNHPYEWNMPWIPVEPGVEFPESFKGRYVRIMVELFPSGDCETSPYLENISLVYRNIEIPPPPGFIAAVARDSAVELSWRGVAHGNLGGYLVYYGVSGGEYFGGNGIISSPLDVGNRTSVRIEGLHNGTLYYFAVASYDREFREPGDFSRETAARPQREFQVSSR